MTPDRTADEVIAEALKAVDAVPRVEYCGCARPKSEHTFWNDRIYDYQGYTCPGPAGGDYWFDEAQTARRHFEARVARLSAALVDLVNQQAQESRQPQEQRAAEIEKHARALVNSWRDDDADVGYDAYHDIMRNLRAALDSAASVSRQPQLDQWIAALSNHDKPHPPHSVIAEMKESVSSQQEPAKGIEMIVDKHKAGLYKKFDVRRADGSDAPGGKHHECSYFVLDMTHDPHAIPALRAYADSCRAEYPNLATDLYSYVERRECQGCGAGLDARTNDCLGDRQHPKRDEPQEKPLCSGCEHPIDFHNAAGCGIEECGCNEALY